MHELRDCLRFSGWYIFEFKLSQFGLPHAVAPCHELNCKHVYTDFVMLFIYISIAGNFYY